MNKSRVNTIRNIGKGVMLGLVMASISSCSSLPNSDSRELKRKAISGDAAAQYELAEDYVYGWNVFASTKKALEWYTKSGNQGYLEAQFKLGDIYANNNTIWDYPVKRDYSKAISWYAKAANQGHKESKYAIAKLYYYGEKVTQDYEKAGYWATLGASQGDYFYSGKLLIEMVRKEEYVITDDPKFFSILKPFSDAGCEDAQYIIGIMYYTGQGVEEDKLEGLKLLKQAAAAAAAEGGDYGAQYVIACMSFEGSEVIEGITQNNSEAIKWLKKSAHDYDSSDAQYLLGNLYYAGDIIEQDKYKAYLLFAKNSEYNNHAESQYILATMCCLGGDRYEDSEEALRWCRLAAKNGSKEAKKLLPNLRKLASEEREVAEEAKREAKRAAERVNRIYDRFEGRYRNVNEEHYDQDGRTISYRDNGDGTYQRMITY